MTRGARETFDSKWEHVRAEGGEDLFTDSPRTQLELMYLWRARQIRTVIERELGGPPLRTLEVGCGRGTLSQYLSSWGYAVTLLDSSRDALAVAGSNLARHGLDGDLWHGDAADLPFESETYDFVFSVGLLEHFDDPGAIVAEKLRVCAHGGIAWEEVIPRKASVQTPAAALAAVQHSAHELRCRLTGRTPVERHHRTRVRPAEVVALFAGAGRVECFGSVPVPHWPLPDGSLPGKRALGASERLMAARARRMEDPWRSSLRWGQSFVVYGVKA